MFPALALSAAMLLPHTDRKVEAFRFEPDVKRVVGFFRKDELRVGTFDAEGEFHQITSVKAMPLADGLSAIRYSGGSLS